MLNRELAIAASECNSPIGKPIWFYRGLKTMRHRFMLNFLTIIETALLCLTLAGCSKQPDQPQQQQPAQQPETSGTAVPGTAGQQATPSEETAKPSAETNKFSGYANNFSSTNKKSTAEYIEPKPAPRTVTLAIGTAINIGTTDTLSTKINRTGEEFSASLNEAIIEGKWTIAKRGAAVKGVITESDPGGRVKGVASMSLKLTSLTLADGREVSISTNSYTVEAKSSKKKDAAKIGIGAGIGAAIGAIAGGGKGAAIGAGVGGAAGTGTVLATRGDPAIVSSETPITFELATPLKVTEKK
jgi:hypothetical protein